MPLTGPAPTSWSDSFQVGTTHCGPGPLTRLDPVGKSDPLRLGPSGSLGGSAPTSEPVPVRAPSRGPLPSRTRPSGPGPGASSESDPAWPVPVQLTRQAQADPHAGGSGPVCETCARGGGKRGAAALAPPMRDSSAACAHWVFKLGLQSPFHECDPPQPSELCLGAQRGERGPRPRGNAVSRATRGPGLNGPQLPDHTQRVSACFFCQLQLWKCLNATQES